METRSVRVRAFAKVNLGLRVLHKRADGYHELRTVFQSISLADRLSIEFRPARNTRLEMDCAAPIADNLVLRAAKALMEAARIHGVVRFRLEKRIPMGGGLGGGSSDAAAALLVLPVLAGKEVSFATLHRIAASVGSDVPFFLIGGTVLGLGRGEEMYPLPAPVARNVLLVAPPVHSSTPEAYRALDRGPESALTFTGRLHENIKFQELVRRLAVSEGGEGWKLYCQNDFEDVVLARHPELRALRKRLLHSGAEPALLSGSGSALFGIFHTPNEVQQARERILAGWRAAGEIRAEAVGFVSRERYQAAYWRALAPHMDGRLWPPRSRYDR